MVEWPKEPLKPHGFWPGFGSFEDWVCQALNIYVNTKEPFSQEESDYAGLWIRTSRPFPASILALKADEKPEEEEKEKEKEKNNDEWEPLDNIPPPYNPPPAAPHPGMVPPPPPAPTAPRSDLPPAACTQSRLLLLKELFYTPKGSTPWRKSGRHWICSCTTKYYRYEKLQKGNGDFIR